MRAMWCLCFKVPISGVMHGPETILLGVSKGFGLIVTSADSCVSGSALVVTGDAAFFTAPTTGGFVTCALGVVTGRRRPDLVTIGRSRWPPTVLMSLPVDILMPSRFSGPVDSVLDAWNPDDTSTASLAFTGDSTGARSILYGRVERGSMPWSEAWRSSSEVA